VSVALIAARETDTPVTRVFDAGERVGKDLLLRREVVIVVVDPRGPEHQHRQRFIAIGGDAGQVAGEVVHRIGAAGFVALRQFGQGGVKPEVSQVLLFRPEHGADGWPSAGRRRRDAGTNLSELTAFVRGGRGAVLDDAIERAIARGEVEPGQISERIAQLPVDLFGHELLMTLKPLTDEAIEEIVDTIFLPLVRLAATAK